MTLAYLILTYAWVLIGLGGLALASYCLAEAWHDIAARKAAGVNGPLSLAARVARRTALGTLATFVTYLCFGIPILLAEEFRPELVRGGWESLAIGSVVVCGEAFKFWVLIANLVDRRRIAARIVHR